MKRIKRFLTVFLLWLPIIIKAEDQGITEGKIDVIMFYLLLASPIFVVLIIVNIIVYINKKKNRQKIVGKKTEIDQLIESSLSKENQQLKINTFKIDFLNDEKIKEKISVKILNPKKNVFENYKVIITNKNFAIIETNENLYFQTDIDNIKTISHNKNDVYDYIFRNGKMLTIESKELFKNLKIVKEEKRNELKNRKNK